MKQFISNFLKYRYLLADLLQRDIKIKYRRSVLGILWSVLNPFLMMLIITAVFSNVFRVNIENYPIYYLLGSTVYNFFTEATSTSMQSILGNGALIKKVYIPKYIFPLEKTLFALVNMLFSLIAVIIMFFILGFVPPLTILLAPILIIYVFVFSLGLGLLLSALSIFFRDVVHLYSVFTTALFYLTPVIFPAETIDSLLPFVGAVMRCNPLYYYVSYFRDIAMYGVVPGLRENLICIGFALVMLIIGSVVLHRKQNRFILYI